MDCLIGSKSRIQQSVVYRNIPHNQRHTQTKSERIEKDMSSMRNLNTSTSNYSHIGKTF
jgi:hypothetical protein